jgi:hypothetical protein
MKTFLPIFAISIFSAQAQTPALRAFDTPDAAAQAVIAAADKNDEKELNAIFGANKAILSSGDAEQDKQELAGFAQMAHQKYRIEKDPMNLHRVILDIGPDDWPFPVPIIEVNGKWSFSSEQGELEVRARRIGANELDTIETLAAAVTAQQQYAEADRDADGILEYAEYIMSSPGKTDGLCSDKSSYNLPKEFGEAEVRAGKSKPTPYHGYYFRVLDAQGPNAPGGAHKYVVDGKHMMAGFAFVAWPAEYGVTGIHTFIVNRDGDIYEKDLGKPASNLTTTVRAYDPDKTWKPVD